MKDIKDEKVIMDYMDYMDDYGRLWTIMDDYGYI